ncbi:hypothetical protein SMD11_5870 [Streptomyces albireticuli]|uniref:Uncharacterized protein n=1 Tax=Streptomyces albireticuli TaxID=1940 RepID=A0A1Z2LAX4_9ACTN|nr:hypothetical protein SMD11_5870 [Streptomyces albireticuli]
MSSAAATNDRREVDVLNMIITVDHHRIGGIGRGVE